MKHYLICDKRADFSHDVKMRALLEEEECVIAILTDAGKFAQKDSAEPDQLLLVCENMVEELPEGFESMYLSRVYGYCITEAGRERFAERKIPCIGQITSSSQFLSMLMGLPKERSDTAEVDMYPKTGHGSTASAKGQPSVGEDFSAWRASLHQKPEEKPQREKKNEETTRMERMQLLREERVNQETDLLMKRERESARNREHAAVVAVASTKGGVGKTTIATQLAICLALTSYGRGRFKVCLVDFDTGFGDVGTTLNCNPNGADLTRWVADIRSRTAKGEAFSDIYYQEEEIRTFLQQKEDSLLYVLPAPEAHTESLEIRSEELEVIMKNLRDNGDFDFVVYDTGNDLKDTTLLAMEQADDVLLIAAQDISCAHCLDMLVKTLESVRFDMGKLRLIINNVMSAKATGIAVSELEEVFAYPCWAKIKHDPLVIRKNNFCSPVVFAPSHDMTKQLRGVVRHLSREDDRLQPEPPKQNFWQKVFSKKGEK